jgi:hypothetical protein
MFLVAQIFENEYLFVLDDCQLINHPAYCKSYYPPISVENKEIPT